MNSAAEKSKQGVQECIGLSWYTLDSGLTLNEWAVLQAEALWEHRGLLDVERDNLGGVVLDDYRSWAIETAHELQEEE